jgi:hypothetical protein
MFLASPFRCLKKKIRFRTGYLIFVQVFENRGYISIYLCTRTRGCFLRVVVTNLKNRLDNLRSKFVFVITARQWHNWPRPHHTTGLIFTSQSKKSPPTGSKANFGYSSERKIQRFRNHAIYFGDMLYNLLPKYDKTKSSVFFFFFLGLSLLLTTT